QAGVFFSGRIGTGLVVARLPGGGWSAPSAIGSAGIGWGFQIGGEVTDMVVVLATDAAVESFSGGGHMSIGTELSAALGPLGRSAATDVRAGSSSVSAAFSYAHSKGAFIGVSLEWGSIVSRPDANRDFYGGPVEVRSLLSGIVPPPHAAAPLYRALAEVEGSSSFGAAAGGVAAGAGASRGSDGGGGGGGGGRGGGGVYAPFDPNPGGGAARQYPMDQAELDQMRRDYEVALALQRQEFRQSTGNQSGGGGGGSSGSLSFGGIGSGGERSDNSGGATDAGDSSPPADASDEWGWQRRNRILRARAETGELANANELGQL
ncbi:unnamed protein product, partial [Phaeothamnion confervicola]